MLNDSQAVMAKATAEQSPKGTWVPPRARWESPMRSSTLKDLPSDVLYEIMLHVITDEDTRNRGFLIQFPLRISQICRSLRTFALGTSILWSRITFFNARPKSLSFDHQRLWLQRSRDASLHIHISNSTSIHFQLSMKAIGKIMGLLLPHVGRWRSFILNYPSLSSKGCRIVLDQLRGRTAPKLEKIRLLVPQRDDQRRNFKLSSMNLPKLWSMEVGGGFGKDYVLEVREQWPGLRCLSLRRAERTGEDSLPMSRVLEILALPSLEELFISGWQIPLQTEPLGPVVSATNLVVIDLGSIESVALLTIMMQVYAPRLRQMHPLLSLNEANIPTLSALPTFPWPRLRRIGVSVTNTPNISLLYRLLENLQDLRELLAGNSSGRILVTLLCNSLPYLHHLSMAGDGDTPSHARQIAQSRLESPHLSSLRYLWLDLDSVENYSWEDYHWLDNHVQDFISDPLPITAEQASSAPAERPRRRYRKAKKSRGGGRILVNSRPGT